MTVCYNKIPFPIPTGLLQRPVVTAFSSGVDLSPYPVTYRVETSDDLGTPTCCAATHAVMWPSAEPRGALYPVDAGNYTFTASVDTGVGGIVEFTPAMLTVVEGTCAQASCEPCVPGTGGGCPECPPCGGCTLEEMFDLASGLTFLDGKIYSDGTFTSMVLFPREGSSWAVEYAPTEITLVASSEESWVGGMVGARIYDSSGLSYTLDFPAEIASPGTHTIVMTDIPVGSIGDISIILFFFGNGDGATPYRKMAIESITFTPAPVC